LYEQYLENPHTVDPSWQTFFKELNDEPTAILGAVRGPSWAPNGRAVIGVEDPEEAAAKAKKAKEQKGKGGITDAEVRARTLDSIPVLMLIRAYRVRGHLMAHLDPLKLQETPPHPELDYRTYGFTEADLDREIFIDNVLGMEVATLRTIVNAVQATYCGSVGVEFMHIQDPEQKAWIQRRIEQEHNKTDFTNLGKKTILERLTEAEGFEKFLQVKYTGTKRFGLEGGESVIPALEQILKRGSQLGIEDVVLGMAHRGRLNVLVNVLNKPYRQVFAEFEGNIAHPDDVQGSGDVKYHLGTSADRLFDGNQVHLSLVANPSHLEAADPVVLGKVRCKQQQIGDLEREKVMGILLHGDAAFAGQGIVSECFAMTHLRGYRTGGTLHIVINNQIGFTTSPQYSRSGTYCTDIAKGVQAPIFHVNGDDPEAVVHVARIATEFRQMFKTDVVIDLVCYRRHGHNESDEPAFTQPKMYKSIGGHETTRSRYAQQLVEEKLVSQAEADALSTDFHKHLEQEFEVATNFKVNKADWLEGKWKGLEAATGEEEHREYATAVDDDLLQEVGRAISTPPESINVNRKIVRQMKAKAQMMATGQGIDWATGEALAFGTLALEGMPVRLSGQDCGRGTFSQRHSVLVDQETEERFVPLNNIRKGQATYEVHDSPLSEFSVLGYEYGYTLAEPNALVLWEAQFGDFANGAQVIFDQFISSAESKWLRFSGLTMLLPHGFEGQGPEHSSARLERYLQACAEDNIQVCNLTTPANYFHALRRQVRRNYRKPLVIMTPKSLLRHKSCVSSLDDFRTGSHFQRVIPETDGLVADDKVRRVVFCTGKVYYDLVAARAAANIDDVAIVRVEQLYPWPKDAVMAEIARYKNAEVFWCQEEPTNMGAWLFTLPRFEFILEELGRDQLRPFVIGRKPAASPACGSMKVHTQQQEKLCEDVLKTPTDQIPQPFKRMMKDVSQTEA
jgi:2-oxoglutarate dehydrogenase E1 component